METTGIDTGSSLNPKEGLALLVKALSKLSKPAVLPCKESLFASMLEQKISQAALSGSAPDPAIATPGGKLLLIAAGKGITLNTRDAESEMITDFDLSDIDESTLAEALALMGLQPVMASALRKDATLAVAEPAGNKWVPPTETAEPTDTVKTALDLVNKRVDQAPTILESVENALLAVAEPTGNQWFPPAETAEPADAAKAAVDLVTKMMDQVPEIPQTVENALLAVAEPTGNQWFSPAETAEPADAAKAAVDLVTKMMDQVPELPITIEIAPFDAPPSTGKTTQLITSPNESPAILFAQAVKPHGETHFESTDDGPPPVEFIHKEEAALAKDPIAAVATESTSQIFHEARPSANRYADPRSPLEAAERRAEQSFAQQMIESRQLKNDRAATNGALPDALQADPSRHERGKRAGASREGAWIAVAPQNPISTIGNGDAAIGQAAPERIMPVESMDKTLAIKADMAKTPGPTLDHQQSRNTMPNRQTMLPEHDISALRMEMPNVAPPLETRTPTAIGSTGIDMQSVIDQIVEARQVMSNDFGRVRILLNPPNLGSVDLDIVVRGARVEVVMTAENTTVQQALQSRSDDIRMALQRQDLKIEGFQVLLQDNGTSQQQTHSGETYRQNREHRESFNTPENAPSSFPVFSSSTGTKSAAGLVSIFA